MKNIYVGTSGYVYRHWKNIFYPKDIPQKDWLPFYAKHFNTLEINATYYRDFPKSVFEKWKKITPEDFRFTIKGPRTITHYKKLKDVDNELDYFFESSAGLSKKLALVLWQFPYSFKQTEQSMDKLKDFLCKLPPTIPQAFEFRHKSWLSEETYDLLNAFKEGFVITDSPRFPTEEVVTGRLAYIRFHGPGRLYSSSYSDEELKAWAKKIKTWAKSREVFVYFNNDNQGFALNNAKTLKKILKV